MTLALPASLHAAGVDSLDDNVDTDEAVMYEIATTSGDTPDNTVATEDTVYYYDLENDPSECIGFLQKPGCGKKPEDAGERGGALQYAVFAVMLAGIGVIGTVITRNVIRRDRVVNAGTDTKNQSDN
jgi:hypothetical protein